MPLNPKYRVFFIIPPEVHLLDVSGPIHVFYEAMAHDAAVSLNFLSVDGKDTHRTSAGLFLSQLDAFSDHSLSEEDILFIPGLNAKLIFDKAFQEENEVFYKWLRKQWERGARICSVCTGAYLLAFAGLLDKKQCTTHWKYVADFRKRFPHVDLHDDRLFVKDGHIYSSAGVSSGIDLALYLLEELYDPFFASKIAKEIVIYLRRAEDDPQLSVFLQYRNHIQNRVHKVQDQLAQHLNQKQKVEELADLVNMSPRNLTRLFKKTTGVTIGEYHEKLKVERAFQLLKDGHKVDAVSLSCGLSSNQLRSLLKKDSGVLPSELS